MNTAIELSRDFRMASTACGRHVHSMDRGGRVCSRQRRVGRMAIAATRAVCAIVHRIGVYAVGIGRNGTDRANAGWCRLPGAMAGPASLSLAAGMNGRGWLARRRHGMDIAVTTRTGRELYVRRASQVVTAMRTHSMLGGDAGMTFPTVHRIEPATVLALVGTDVAVKAFRQAVNGAFEVSQIEFVAIDTRVLILGAGRMHSEQQASDEDGKRLSHRSMVDTDRRRCATSNYAPSVAEPNPRFARERLRKTRIPSSPLLEYYALG